MDRDTLAVGIAAVLAGLAVTLGVLALAETLFLFVVAVPMGIAAYLVWFHASGRLEAHLHRRARRAQRNESDAGLGGQERSDAGTGARGGQSRFAEAARERVAHERAGNDRHRRARTGGDRRRTSTDGAGRADPNAMTRREACETLGVDPDASQETVKRAYRDRVKQVHPDSGGDEEAFKRVTRAYETLKD